MSEPIAYVSGFFDGEGCITIGLASRLYRQKRYWFPKIQASFVNTDRNVLEHIQSILNMGEIYESQARKSNWTDYFTLTMTKREDIIKFCQLLEPFVFYKKKLIHIAKDATIFAMQIANNPQEQWTKKNLDYFEAKYIKPSRRLGREVETRGRPRKYYR